ncbi:MAG: NUDIX domain-containing protein [Nitrospirae bacterium]|nr:NUDIX domain-containing protein [Nitrospirota bacterium]
MQNPTPDEEILEVVDKEGRVTGLAPRSELHSNPSLIHRVVHVLVFNSKGEILLQKRSMNKDVAPGRWDTSVGGHINPGEEILAAAAREMREELGVSGQSLRYLYQYLYANHRETELVSSFTCVYDGAFSFNREEIEEVRFWPLKKIALNLSQDIFSSHFKSELNNYLAKNRYHGR